MSAYRGEIGLQSETGTYIVCPGLKGGVDLVKTKVKVASTSSGVNLDSLISSPFSSLESIHYTQLPASRKSLSATFTSQRLEDVPESPFVKAQYGLFYQPTANATPSCDADVTTDGPLLTGTLALLNDQRFFDTTISARFYVPKTHAKIASNHRTRLGLFIRASSIVDG